MSTTSTGGGTPAQTADFRTPLLKAIRVADQLCTGYAILRDVYRDRSMFSDVIVLLVSVWLCALSFASDAIAAVVTPVGFSKDLWQGLLSTSVFALSLLQLQVNWKGRAQLYQQALTSLSSFTKEYRAVAEVADELMVRNALTRYQTITDAIEPIPESKFLSLKRRHKLKVEVSKILDSRPGISIPLIRFRLWLRDNLGISL